MTASGIRRRRRDRLVIARYKEIYGYEDADVTDHWAFWRSIILPADMQRAQDQYDEMMAGTRAGIDIVVQSPQARPPRSCAQPRVAGPRRGGHGHARRQRSHRYQPGRRTGTAAEGRAISVMADGFGLFDADDRLILFNEGFVDEGTRQVIGDPTGYLRGRRRYFVEHDMPDTRDPAFDREAWIGRRMERHRNRPRTRSRSNGAATAGCASANARTASNDYVGIWSDVTEIQAPRPAPAGCHQRLSTACPVRCRGPAINCNEPYVTPKVNGRSATIERI